MRDYLRRTCDDIWVIDCSPEGHQPEVNTRIFQGVQQPVCIVLASRSAKSEADTPAKVSLSGAAGRPPHGEVRGPRQALTLDEQSVDRVPIGLARAVPAGFARAHGQRTKLEDLFIYNGSGVMPGRTWIIAPDAESLERRWQTLVNAPADKRRELFHPHLRDGKLGDRHIKRVVEEALAGLRGRPKAGC